MTNVLVAALVAPEEQCDGAGTGVTADGGADGIDQNFTVEFGEACFDEVGNCTGVVFAGGMTDKALTVIVEAVCGILFHFRNDFTDDTALGADFLAGNELAGIVDVEQRADIELCAEPTGNLGNTAALDVEGQVRGEEPVMQLKLVFFGPEENFFKGFAFVTKIGQLIHQQTVTGCGTEGVNNLDLTVRILFQQLVTGDAGRV